MCEAKCLTLILVVSFAFCSCSFSANKTELPMHKGTVKTIYAAHEEIIDCVDYYEQPAFDHPLLKDKKYEYKNEIPEFLKDNTYSTNDLEVTATQTWHQSGDCPEGTVPILRQPKRDLDAVRKLKSRVPRNRSIGSLDDYVEHEYSFVEVQPGRYYYGGRSVISIWKPFIENGLDEFSLAQMWVTKGYGAALETIEAGWHIFPERYKQDKEHPRLFIFWTADNYEKTGCYNLDCPGFIFSGGRVMPGGVLIPSILNGKPSIMDVSFDRDVKTGDWWLKVLNQVVGRWPASLFEILNDHADTVQWGGEIVNADPKIHTATEMGSGHFPSEGVGKAAYIHSLQVKKEANGRYVNADSLIDSVTKPNCYDFKLNSVGNPYPGVNFFFGGPGYSNTCVNS